MDSLAAGLEEFRRRVGESGVPTEVYFTEVSFDSVEDPQIKRYLNDLPTSLELETDEVDRLIAVGRLMLRHDPAFKLYKERNAARLVDDAESNEAMCSLFGYPRCPEKLLDEEH